ncbi:pilus assembly protein [Vibrio fortis]|uniref:Pilus assembly protein n=1 Tax=Vibrio fortis TaxID=212667 RepID=A0A5N3SDD2_9VIBR|nr:pilus assembly protein [Vibrio fortis]KAB0304195.1 pilus assembly protein [Vibrio fortis]|tara:strand:+ start:2940 stop:3431 length:492 start_codon:yes stop_codon:yes gene_type:complete
MKPRNFNKGVASIEFVFGFMSFWLMCVCFIELSYLSFISSVNDLIITESVRESKINQGNYKDSFKQLVSENTQMWAGIIDENKFRMSIYYIDSVNTLAGIIEPCSVIEGESFTQCGSPKGSAIAIYSIEYQYKPIFNFLLNDDFILKREVLSIQEYERDQFYI